MKYFNIKWHDKNANKFHPLVRNTVVSAVDEKDAVAAFHRVTGSPKQIIVESVTEV